MAKTLVEMNTDLTLMMLDQNGDYHPADVMTFQYYLAADPSFSQNLQQNCEELMVKIYNDHYHVFREREPNDPNYIAVVGVKPRVIEPSEYADQPWLKGNCPAWGESNLIALTAAGHNKLSPQFFGAVLNSDL